MRTYLYIFSVVFTFAILCPIAKSDDCDRYMSKDHYGYSAEPSCEIYYSYRAGCAQNYITFWREMFINPLTVLGGVLISPATLPYYTVVRNEAWEMIRLIRQETPKDRETLLQLFTEIRASRPTFTLSELTQIIATNNQNGNLCNHGPINFNQLKAAILKIRR